MLSVIVDIETTGLPTAKTYTYKDTHVLPRIVQLSYIVTDFKNIYHEHDHIIKRNNFDITNANIHGITNEISDGKGEDIKKVLTNFDNIIKDKKIYAYNSQFDISIIQSEFLRLDLEVPKINHICMMKHNQVNGRNIKLIKLYNDTFKTEKEQSHNSIEDCRMLYEIMIFQKQKLFLDQ